MHIPCVLIIKSCGLYIIYNSVMNGKKIGIILALVIVLALVVIGILIWYFTKEDDSGGGDNGGGDNGGGDNGGGDNGGGDDGGGDDGGGDDGGGDDDGGDNAWSLDAAVYNEGSDFYYFWRGSKSCKKGYGQPVQIDQNDTLDSTVSGVWGFRDIDAAVHTTGSRYYFFKDDEYYRRDNGDTLLIGPISNAWGSIPNDLDAAVHRGTTSNVYYFFKGSQYWKRQDGSNSGPFAISQGWNGLPNDLDAAVWNQKSETYYFFKGQQVWEKKTGESVTGPTDISNTGFAELVLLMP